MKKVTKKQFWFFFTYPIIHAVIVLLIIAVSEMFMHSNPMLSEVIFMAVLLLIAPVFAFPKTLEEFNNVFSSWHPILFILFVYAIILIVYALPLLLIYKKTKNR